VDFLFKRQNSETKSIRYKIVIIESLIFLLPFVILTYVFYQSSYQFNVLQLVIFAGICLLILSGLIVLRQILDRISTISISLKKAESGKEFDIQEDIVELEEISVSINGLIRKLEKVKGELAKKSLELLTIRDLTEIIEGDLSLDDQMRILLEKCMAVTGAQIGSVFIVEPEMRQAFLSSKSLPILASELYHFRVCATMGHGNELKEGAIINIEQSIVKPVLLEKTPFLVTDISKDPRTLKNNDPYYGSPSFLSMPVITEDTVSGIINLAHKKDNQLFDDNDVQIISVIMRDISFSFENAILKSRVKEQQKNMKKHLLELEKEREKKENLEMKVKFYEGKYKT
jgi:two-component system, cell cycle sensor histidine kinase and response regulator CckA